ncbi:hypothetical protein Ae201684_005861 [Aphanomyces euteiches]|uniref:Reverse transcriptase domain-containing protein n=1 Tax=Aphanomyces euteiches TaxID=100861 RepID=A0A6G0XDK6_9STRA|nr:hypothetical protein Ae201684_005861 [Aphanomyces euteiches]
MCCLLPHQRKSYITLLYKKGERTDPGNYGPIALMPLDVKILSRVLAHRLSEVSNKLIQSSQAGFVKGRNLTDRIHLIQALQHKATRNNEEWYATFLDFAKVYDMCPGQKKHSAHSGQDARLMKVRICVTEFERPYALYTASMAVSLVWFRLSMAFIKFQKPKRLQYSHLHAPRSAGVNSLAGFEPYNPNSYSRQRLVICS